MTFIKKYCFIYCFFVVVVVDFFNGNFYADLKRTHPAEKENENHYLIYRICLCTTLQLQVNLVFSHRNIN